MANDREAVPDRHQDLNGLCLLFSLADVINCCKYCGLPHVFYVLLESEQCKNSRTQPLFVWRLWKFITAQYLQLFLVISRDATRYCTFRMLMLWQKTASGLFLWTFEVEEDEDNLPQAFLEHRKRYSRCSEIPAPTKYSAKQSRHNSFHPVPV